MSPDTRTKLGLERVEPLALKERVIAQLTDLIERGTLAPGDRLPSERELSEELGVSRGTTREAVQFLQALGLVDIRHGAGTFVREGSEPDALRERWRAWTVGHAGRVFELIEVRKGLESTAAELAAERAGEAQLEAMERAVAETDPSNAATVTGLVQADVAFHNALCAAAGNRALAELAAELNDQLLQERATAWNIPGRTERSYVEHRQILDAVRSGSAQKARAALLTHLNSVEADLKASVLNTPESKEGGQTS